VKPWWKKSGLVPWALGVACALAGALLAAARTRPAPLELSGLVTADEVVVAPAVEGRLVALHVREGDTVRRGQVVAELEPAELAADRAFFTESAAGVASQVHEQAAALRSQERETAARIRQAAASVAAMEGERDAAAAQLEEARAIAARQDQLAQAGATADQDRDHARRAFETAAARVAALDRHIEVQRATLELARAGAEQAAARRAALETARRQEAAAAAQREKAEVRLAHARLTAPADGVVDVRAARLGEVVGVGQPVLTLVDPDALWIRADVEETYVDRIRLGDTLRVRLASGEERAGTVFFRGAVAGFATQRDVSRTKRDIRTFELRLRVDNRDRRLALGASAQVLVPVGG
jgi:multidrug resistance efflux pump